MLKKFIEWGLTRGVKILAIFIAALVLNRVLQIAIRKIIVKGIKSGIKENEKKRTVETLMSAVGGTVRFLVWVSAVLMVLSEFGINIGPILASLGIVGLAVGMAARDTVADFISGFFILLEGQYKVGDKIKIGDVEGEVVEFNLRRTVVKSENGFLHFFPNSQIKIVGRKIE